MPAWYVEEQHVQERRKMKHGIERLLQARKPDYSADWMQKLPRMARRLEESLFRSALSFEEYSDTGTLKKRLRTLAKALRVGAQQQKRNADEKTEPGDNSGAQTTQAAVPSVLPRTLNVSTPTPTPPPPATSASAGALVAPPVAPVEPTVVATPPAAEKWPCPACTFLNEATDANCDVCQEPRSGFL